MLSFTHLELLAILHVGEHLLRIRVQLNLLFIDTTVVVIVKHDIDGLPCMLLHVRFVLF